MRARVLLLVLLAAALARTASGQSGGAYSLTWNKIGANGAVMTGGSHRLESSAGQIDARQLAGGAYIVNGGFWAVSSSGTVDVPVPEAMPAAFAARAPVPNRTSTTLAFDLPAARRVRLVVHGIDGRAIRRLMDGQQEAGRHRAIWDGRDDRGHLVASGIYFARLVAGEFTSTQRIVRFE